MDMANETGTAQRTHGVPQLADKVAEQAIFEPTEFLAYYRAHHADIPDAPLNIVLVFSRRLMRQFEESGGQRAGRGDRLLVSPHDARAGAQYPEDAFEDGWLGMGLWTRRMGRLGAQAAVARSSAIVHP